MPRRMRGFSLQHTSNMKTLLLLLVPFVALAAQNRPDPGTGAPGRNISTGCPRGDCPVASLSASTPTSLSAADLTAALDEERVAHDLYQTAAERWQLPVFSNIAAAELRHAAAIEQLAANAGIAVAPAQKGTYATMDAGHLYQELLPLVNGSREGALKAAALIEETDITDLRALIARVTDEPTKAVLAQLEVASQRHLAAFVRNLRTLGVTYQPQVLSAEEFATIEVADAPRGRGWGYRGGR
jgi:hypothetical protein